MPELEYLRMGRPDSDEKEEPKAEDEEINETLDRIIDFLATYLP